MRASRCPVAERLDARLVTRPEFVELFLRAVAAELPFAHLREIALDHRLDVDTGLTRADDDAGDPAARVRYARAGAALYANAAGGRGVDPQSHLLEQRTASEELAPAPLGGETGVAAPIARAELATRTPERERTDAGDGYADLGGHRRNTRLALVPPKPRLLLITALSVALRV